MAIYHLHLKNISRGDGRSAVACAAYRAGDTLPNEAEERDSRFSGRRDVRYAAIVLPEGAPGWMADRGQLWNAVERAEIRKDARLAKEIEVALPRELPFGQKLAVVDALARALASSGLAVDYAIHEDGTNHNPHAHLMMTTRAIGPAGFGKKLRGADDKAFLQQTRALWAKIVNQALGQVGAAVMVDHRSHAARGIERAAGDHRGIDRAERQLRREARDQAGQDMDRASQAIRDAMARSQADMRRFPQLAAREDWPPAVRTPPVALTRDEREEYRAYWREVDKRMFQAERAVIQNRDLDEARAEALKPGPERQQQVERVRASVERDTMPDMGSEALRQYGEMQERVNQAFAARGITVENNIDVAALNAQLQEFRRTLLDIRMRELQAIDRDQERERNLPVPGPDRMPISPVERDQAQERMTAEVEREEYPLPPRPPERPSLADFRDRQQPVERQPERSAETAARSLADWRAQRQQSESGRDRDALEHSREPDLERDR